MEVPVDFKLNFDVAGAKRITREMEKWKRMNREIRGTGTSGIGSGARVSRVSGGTGALSMGGYNFKDVAKVSAMFTAILAPLRAFKGILESLDKGLQEVADVEQWKSRMVAHGDKGAKFLKSPKSKLPEAVLESSEKFGVDPKRLMQLQELIAKTNVVDMESMAKRKRFRGRSYSDIAAMMLQGADQGGYDILQGIWAAEQALNKGSKATYETGGELMRGWKMRGQQLIGLTGGEIAKGTEKGGFIDHPIYGKITQENLGEVYRRALQDVMAKIGGETGSAMHQRLLPDFQPLIDDYLKSREGERALTKIYETKRRMVLTPDSDDPNAPDRAWERTKQGWERWLINIGLTDKASDFVRVMNIKHQNYEGIEDYFSERGQ